MSGYVRELPVLEVTEKKVIESSSRSPADGKENEFLAIESEEENTYNSCKVNINRSSCVGQRTLFKSRSKFKDSHSEALIVQTDSKEERFRTLSPKFRYRSYDTDNGHENCSIFNNAEGTLSKNGTPTYLKWAEDLQCLLQDLEGVNLFKKYLTQENCADSLNFWFACEGLKKANPTDVVYIQQVIKLIYKKFIRSGQTDIKQGTREEIASKINSKIGFDQTIFDNAQKNIEIIMARTTYPSFLKSELYLQYVQLMQQKINLGSTKQVVDLESVNENVNFRQGSYILQTLHENAELKASQCDDELVLSREAVKKQSRVMKSSYTPEAQSGSLRLTWHEICRDPQLYHEKYSIILPTSVQDRELCCISLDTLSVESMLLTDGSNIDCSPTVPSRSQVKIHQHMIEKNANLHSDYLGHQSIIPKTQQTPKKFTNLKEEKFAAILTQKLLQVKKEREDQEQVEEYFQKLQAEEGMSLSQSCVRNLQCPLNVFVDIPSQFLSQALTDDRAVSEDSDQSILDQHVSRVWNDSAHQTPSGSPSLFSPSSISVSPHLERHRSDSSGFGSLVSLRLSTSGMSTAGLYASPYEPVHSHHNSFGRPKEQIHHHHSVVAKRDEMAPELPSVTSAEHKQTWDSKDVSWKSCFKKLSTNDFSSSCNDSGVSLSCDPVLPVLASSKRVSSWMMDNEKYSSRCCGPDSEKDSFTKHKKSNRSSLFTSSSIPDQQSPTHTYPWMLQPIAIDPSMPILPPPDTATQLLEAKRRLEDEAHLKCGKNKMNKKLLSNYHPGSGYTDEFTIIGYYFSGESVPYRTKFPGKNVTLKQFKTLLSRKGNYRYFFKKRCNEFETGIINEEISNDNEVLPLWEGKVFATVEMID
ncbi:axin-1-like [Tachypleus tridentatus]|uniref:axin-1-like n=1 Tax=Tachypleus tridentatus TaxID=6853 RepID=UPI003FD162F3